MNSPRQGWSESRGSWKRKDQGDHCKNQSTAKCSGQELSLPQGIVIVKELLQDLEAEHVARVILREQDKHSVGKVLRLMEPILFFKMSSRYICHVLHS